ncbi:MULTISPECIES: outer membrane protein assembly factor BamD [unclassified Arcicella]|uniref:outer membrane protein assembly factor BamD n=1 Tax=unclassified Arcicella TaxID=2644986 RepID=UPI00285E83F0|nr:MULTISPECIES: outer membrane protein assembly factor BamD [unclassified Arcicella]MDR6560969.1 outer membrane protein assembly factor BamD [Arcicella sp. BE51]MDR6810853.1 outer membrane protein assembly factor BamD [Arcicella sp. BE140]MDR6822203.1 outer membrane protein assembly factor BamD [Arcicella sp. BE139]
MQRTHKFLLFILFALTLSACSNFEKIRKMTDEKKKYDAAIRFFKKGQYDKASILFEELLPILTGTDQQEIATFYQAYCDYHTGNYEMANFHFKRFAETFARSEYYEEAVYMSAYSLYKNSPQFNLDQSGTITAINELQNFINNYSDSKFREETSDLIKELRKKLEKKSYEKVKLYYKTSEFNIATLKSAVIEINNFQKDYPDSDYNEELAFLKVQSQFDLAQSTIESKQKERFDDAIKYYQDLVDKYPKSDFLKKAEKLYDISFKESDRIAKLEAEYKAARDKEKSNTSKVGAGDKQK